MRQRTRLDAAVGTYRRLEQELEDGLALAELAEEEADEEVYGEAEAALAETRDEAKTARAGEPALGRGRRQ